MPIERAQHAVALRDHPNARAYALSTARVSAKQGVKPLRIALLGQFGVGNFGNDGSLEAMILSLRQTCPEAELTAICMDPGIVRQTLGIEAVKMTRPGIRTPWLDRVNRMLGRLPYKLYGPIRVFHILRDFDALVLAGTGAFDDFGDTPYGMPYVFLKWMLLARLRRRAVAAVSIGAGPAYHRLSRSFFAGAARSAEYRSFRDGISRDFVASLGVDTKADRLFPDLAFGLPIPAPVERDSDGPITVGLGVMNYRGRTGNGTLIYNTYIAKLAEFTRYLLSRGFAVRLILGQDNDEVAVGDLMRDLERSASAEELKRVVFQPSRSLHDVMAQMQAADIVVATRFHNFVCALRVGLPVISLGYLEKFDALAAEMGLSEYCTDVERFSVAWLIPQFERLLEERAVRAVRIRETVEHYTRQLAIQESLLRSYILDRSRR